MTGKARFVLEPSACHAGQYWVCVLYVSLCLRSKTLEHLGAHPSHALHLHSSCCDEVVNLAVVLVGEPITAVIHVLPWQCPCFTESLRVRHNGSDLLWYASLVREKVDVLVM